MSSASNYMHATKRYRVVSVLTVVKIGGKDHRFNRGQLLPPTVGLHVIDHLLAIGHIKEAS